MTVAELIDLLQTMPQNKKVICDGNFDFVEEVCETDLPTESDSGEPIDLPVVMVCAKDTGK